MDSRQASAGTRDADGSRKYSNAIDCTTVQHAEKPRSVFSSRLTANCDTRDKVKCLFNLENVRRPFSQFSEE